MILKMSRETVGFPYNPFPCVLWLIILFYKNNIIVYTSEDLKWDTP